MKKIFSVSNLTIGGEKTYIALPLTGKTAEELCEGARKASETTAEIIEIRADFYEEIRNRDALTQVLKRIRSVLPDRCLLFTLRTKGEGGALKVTDEEYKEILMCAAESSCVDLIDIEAFLNAEDSAHPDKVSGISADLLGKCHGLGLHVVFSNHDFSGTPVKDELMRRLALMEEAGADIVKIACMPTNRLDAGRIMAVSALAKERLTVPHVLIAMGEKGALSRTCAGRIGSAFSFGCLPGQESAPGQMDVDTLRHAMDEIGKKKGNVFISGFMGTGKSTIARRAAECAGITVKDTDAMIEDSEGMSIPEIFEQFGQQYFRDAETAVLASFADRGGEVVSTGGGIVLREENAALMHALGTVVVLRASASELLKRLRGSSDTRPNLRGRLSEEGIRELMDQREAFYVQAANCFLDTEMQDAEECADAILKMLSDRK